MRNLFFNTPVRRKFLRTDQTEQGRIVDVVHNLALAHPEIGFEAKLKPPPDTTLPRAHSKIGTFGEGGAYVLIGRPLARTAAVAGGCAMLELLLTAILLLVGLVLLPLLLLGLFVKAIFWMVLLPFRALAAIAGFGVGILALFAKGVGAVLAAVLAVVALAGAVLILPLVPILAVVFMIWLLVRLFRPGPVVQRM